MTNISNAQVFVSIPFEQRKAELELMDRVAAYLEKVAQSQFSEKLSLAQACAYTGWDKQTLRRKVKDGVLKNSPDPISGLIGFSKSDIDEKRELKLFKFKGE